MYIGTVDFTPTPVNIIFEILTNQKKNPGFRLDNRKINFLPFINRIQPWSVRIPEHNVLNTSNHAKALMNECGVLFEMLWSFLTFVFGCLVADVVFPPKVDGFKGIRTTGFFLFPKCILLVEKMVKYEINNY